MNLKEELPPFHEFHDQINLNFDQRDIDFQKSMAEKAGFLSWMNYLQIIHYLISNVLDIKAFANDLLTESSQANKIAGSIPLLINRNTDTSLHEEMKPIYERVQKMPKDDQVRIGDFEHRMQCIFLMLVIDKNKENFTKTKSILPFLIECQKQYLILNSDISKRIQESITYLEAYNFTYTNKEINPNCYFPDKQHLLSTLHDALLEKGLINRNDDFEKSFEKKIPESNTKCTEWISNKIRELFYLLYILSDRKQFPNGISIATIAYRLFKFQNNPTENSFQSNLNEIINRFNDEDYISKNLKNINSIIKELKL